MSPAVVIALFALGIGAEPPTAPNPPVVATRSQSPAPQTPQSADPVVADTPHTTASGHTFLVPSKWSVVDLPERRTTLLRPPDDDRNLIAVVEVRAVSPEEAALAAARAVGIERAIDGLGRRYADRNGFTRITEFYLVVAATELRTITASVRAIGDTWIVVVVDLDDSAYSRLLAERMRITGTMAARGYVPPNIAGMRPHALDAPRLTALDEFITHAQAKLGVPGVAVGIVQDGAVVVRKGYGVRAAGHPEPVTPATRFLIWSATKPLTTLMLAALVDEHKLEWDTPVKALLPQFAFGDAQHTAKVQLRHLVGACSGASRQDLEWTYRGTRLTADAIVDLLGASRPTSEIGTRFEYSNLTVAVAGFAAAHVAYPELELGEAYDRAMQSRVFTPLGMRDTTLDHARARTGDFAVGHEHDADGALMPVSARINATVAAVRPTGGAWSTVDDLLAYVRLELADGRLGDAQLVSHASLHARRQEQIQLTNGGYGLGLFVDRSRGMTIYSHHGDGHGYNANLLWIPEARVGAVILTNATAGSMLRTMFQRKLLELLFDVDPGAERVIELAADTAAEERRHYRPMLERPPGAAIRARLAPRYRHPALGDLAITMRDGGLWLETDAWEAEIVVYRERDYLRLSTWAIANYDLDIVDGSPRALVVSDGTHSYVCEEVRNSTDAQKPTEAPPPFPDAGRKGDGSPTKK
ncbi:MAG: serine hydrolase [Planctomycetota bacterium]